MVDLTSYDTAGDMKKASEYLEHARECRDLAAQMDNPAQREQMLQIAAQWEQLARERSEFVQRRPEPAARNERDG